MSRKGSIDITKGRNGDDEHATAKKKKRKSENVKGDRGKEENGKVENGKAETGKVAEHGKTAEYGKVAENGKMGNGKSVNGKTGSDRTAENTANRDVIKTGDLKYGATVSYNQGFLVDDGTKRIENGNGSTRTSVQSGDSGGMEVTTVDTRCGYRNCKPDCLQRCNNTKVALAVLSLYATIQGFVVNGIINVNVSVVERRFGLSSVESSVMISAYDVAAGLFVVPIGYYGRLGHKSRWLATACLIMGIGSGIMVIPHLATGPYVIGGEQSDMCRGNNTGACGDPGLRGYLGVFLLGQFLHGIGGTTLYTLGLIWLDDNVKIHQASLYFGIFQCMTVIGPALGFVVGGKLLDVYVDFDTVDINSLSVTPADPRWVGAWWLGLLIASVLAISCSLVLFCFGWEMPDAAENRKTRVSQAHSDGGEDTTVRLGFGMTLKDMPKCTWLLLRNPTFMCLTVSMTAFMMVSGGFGAFVPKFIMNQFNKEASNSALIAGAVAIPATAGGQLLGGVISSKMKLKVRGLIRLSLVTVIALMCTPVMMARCDAANSAGIDTFYGNSSININYVNLSGACNSDCRCNTRVREPVCGVDGVEYFNPCYAGCTSDTRNEQMEKIYSNCSCIAANLMSQKSKVAANANLGICATDCILLPVFCVVMFVLAFTLSVANTPMITATLRCIPDNLRGYALAVQWVFVRFVGTIPGPILFGTAVDSACNVWQNKCGERGSCWLYDTYKFGVTMTLLAVSIGGVSFIFLFLAQFLYKAPLDGATDDNMLEYTKTTDISPRTRDSIVSSEKGESNNAFIPD